MALPCKQEPIEGVNFYKSKVTLSRKEREKEKNDITKMVVEAFGKNAKTDDEIKALTKDIGIVISKDNGHWWYWDETIEAPEKYKDSGLTFEDTEAINDLRASKVNKDMIDWGTMPTTITDKNTFYKEVSKVFATADHSIYMFGTPEELQRLWDIWGKPEGYKATHTYIAIKPISNKSSRHAFIMWIFSSNYANPYFRIISGYAGTYVSADDKGWVNINSLATPSSTGNNNEIVDLGIREWDKQQVTLPLDKLNQCKGLKIWVKLNVPTQGGGTKPYMVERNISFYRDSPIKDYGFVTIPDVSKTYGQAILLPQVNIETGVLRITSSEQNGAGAVPSDVVIVYAQGIK